MLKHINTAKSIGSHRKFLRTLPHSKQTTSDLPGPFPDWNPLSYSESTTSELSVTSLDLDPLDNSNHIRPSKLAPSTSLPCWVQCYETLTETWLVLWKDGDIVWKVNTVLFFTYNHHHLKWPSGKNGKLGLYPITYFTSRLS